MSDDALNALRATDLTAWKRVIGNRKSAAMSKARKAAELAAKTEEVEALGRLLEKATEKTKGWRRRSPQRRAGGVERTTGRGMGAQERRGASG